MSDETPYHEIVATVIREAQGDVHQYNSAMIRKRIARRVAHLFALQDPNFRFDEFIDRCEV